MPACSHHAESTASYSCPSCLHFLCTQCVQSAQNRPNTFICPECRSPLLSLNRSSPSPARRPPEPEKRRAAPYAASPVQPVTSAPLGQSLPPYQQASQPSAHPSAELLDGVQGVIEIFKGPWTEMFNASILKTVLFISIAYGLVKGFSAVLEVPMAQDAFAGVTQSGGDVASIAGGLFGMGLTLFVTFLMSLFLFYMGFKVFMKALFMMSQDTPSTVGQRAILDRAYETTPLTFVAVCYYIFSPLITFFAKLATMTALAVVGFDPSQAVADVLVLCLSVMPVFLLPAAWELTIRDKTRLAGLSPQRVLKLIADRQWRYLPAGLGLMAMLIMTDFLQSGAVIITSVSFLGSLVSESDGINVLHGLLSMVVHGAAYGVHLLLALVVAFITGYSIRLERQRTSSSYDS